MNLSCGIVGLPNVGKSTLFNALLKKQVANVANYPFCTIEPNKGVVPVPEDRLSVLAKIVKTSKIVPAVVEFVDIAGLVKGAAQGEGLGNKFLANIREVSLICHVVRFFDDPDVSHVSDKIDPQSDVEIINSELILADLQTLDKQRKPNTKLSKEQIIFFEAIETLKNELDKGIMAKDINLTDLQKEAIKPLCLLTAKPIIYIANISENQLKDQQLNSSCHPELVSELVLNSFQESKGIPKQACTEPAECVRNDTHYNFLENFPFKPVIALSAKMEAELAVLSESEQKEYLNQYGLKEAGLDRLAKLAYQTLNLISFLTAGEKSSFAKASEGRREVRAWTIKKGMTAREAAGVIHSDFAKNFIKADIISYNDFVKYEGWIKAKEQGKVRSEGADYKMREGEVVEFKVNC